MLEILSLFSEENKERRTCQGAREISLDLRSTCLLIMGFRFVLSPCCVPTWVTKILPPPIPTRGESDLQRTRVIWCDRQAAGQIKSSIYGKEK